MLLSSLNDARGYEHVYVSPHLDDAVLSCGGRIGLQRDAGAAVLVVTICAGIPPHDATLSPFAQYLHREWQLGGDPMVLRRKEDREALATLDCDGLHLDELDAPYRVAAYGERDAVFSTPVADDPLGPAADMILEQLHAQQPTARLYIPLGIGQHVDHQVIYDASLRLRERGADILWFEDAPYAATWPNAIDQRIAMLDTPLEPDVVVIDTTLERKLQAIAAYRSQRSELFGDTDMIEVMTAYAASIMDGAGTLGERGWRQGRQAHTRLDL